MMNKLKISIDDIREIPKGYDKLFLNPEEFIAWRTNHQDTPIAVLTLDHDMGERFMDGYDLVKVLVDDPNLNIQTIDRIQLHTDNMIGFANMYHYLIAAQKHDIIPTTIKIIKEKINLIDGQLSFSGYSPIKSTQGCD